MLLVQEIDTGMESVQAYGAFGPKTIGIPSCSWSPLLAMQNAQELLCISLQRSWRFLPSTQTPFCLQEASSKALQTANMCLALASVVSMDASKVATGAEPLILLAL